MEGVITRNAYWKGNSQEYLRVIVIGGSRKQHTCRICHSYFIQYFELKTISVGSYCGNILPSCKAGNDKEVGRMNQAAGHSGVSTHTHTQSVYVAPRPHFFTFEEALRPPVFYCFLQGQPRGALTSIKRVGAKGQEELRRGGDKVREA